MMSAKIHLIMAVIMIGEKQSWSGSGTMEQQMKKGQLGLAFVIALLLHAVNRDYITGFFAPGQVHERQDETQRAPQRNENRTSRPPCHNLRPQCFLLGQV